MNLSRQDPIHRCRRQQGGMALLVSLVFLLLLTLIGISSMQSATLQEKMAGSVTLRNTSFQTAEAVLRMGENAVQQSNYSLAVCTTVVRCAPPPESATLVAAQTDPTSGVIWVAAGSGFYGVQNIGTSMTAVGLPSNTSATLYRITAVAISGNSRTVLESIYAKY
ncbi:pilus assembly PilX family protein [Pseudomonas sp. COR18]